MQGSKEKETEVREDLIFDASKWRSIKRKLYAVLIEKTEDQARTLVRNEDRDGIFAYLRLNQFFTEISGLGIGERRHKVARPEKVKREESRKSRTQETRRKIGGSKGT